MPPGSPIIDLTPLAGLIIAALVDGMHQLFSPLPHDFEQWLLSGIQSLLASHDSLNVLTHVPVEWTTRNPEVRSLYQQGLAAELGLITLVNVIQGYRVMHGSIDVYEAVFRSSFFALIGMSLSFWLDNVLLVVNWLADAVMSAPLTIRTESLPDALLLGLVLIVAAVLALFAWIKGALGTIFVAVLIVAAPYLLVLSTLPMFEGLGKWWVEEMTTWLLRGFMVALVLRLGLAMAAENMGGFQYLFAAVTFWLAYTMDTRLRRFSVGAWGNVAQLGVFARAGRAISGVAGGGAPAAAAATAAP
jgi:hypothetical protein